MSWLLGEIAFSVTLVHLADSLAEKGSRPSVSDERIMQLLMDALHELERRPRCGRGARSRQIPLFPSGQRRLEFQPGVEC